MNLKTVHITIKDRKQVFREAANALGKARKGKKIKVHHEVSFQNINTLRNVLTQKRLELLHAIKVHHPKSIYELAKIVNRDLKNVNEELQLLQELGFVSLEDVETERKRVKPSVDFDAIRVEIAI